ncbi:hypothetical protein HZ326_7995 [Fusarium oxysporum f. sp. albedinis]|nr:hypothetical protein HZ326_7995 [Fusarium oxysporum f. sp. albedinis]
MLESCRGLSTLAMDWVLTDGASFLTYALELRYQALSKHGPAEIMLLCGLPFTGLEGEHEVDVDCSSCDTSE